ncbi:MAG: hypothetical protein WCA23_30665 [Stellaceae bacterium]
MAMEGTGETGSLAEEEEFEPSVALERMVNLAKEPYGGYKESSIGREFSLEYMLDSFTQPKNVTEPGSGETTCIRL